MTTGSFQEVKTTLDKATMRIAQLEGEVDRLKGFTNCPRQAEEVQTSHTVGAARKCGHQEGTERAPWGVRIAGLEEEVTGAPPSLFGVTNLLG